MKLNILAYGAHPDDVELACSGTLLKHKLLGHTIGVVDLTRGELGSRGTSETRAMESKKSSEVLQLDVRINLGMEDGFFKNNKTNQLLVIQSLRTHQPDIVLINAPKDRHPDHGRAAQLLIDSCFLSGLIKIETKDSEGVMQTPWRPKRVFHYIQDTFIEPNVIIDITEVFAKKIESISCFETQFYSKNVDGPETYISTENFLDKITYRAAQLGSRIGVKYGEGFILTNANAIGLNDMSSIILPKLV